MDLVFEKRGERTILAHSYAEPPFRIGRSFDLDGAAYVILVCSGPGIFAGDTLRQSVHVARGARVVLTSQSALQVHPSPFLQSCNPAILQSTFAVEEDAELHCHWDAVIPFAGARLDQRVDVRIAESAHLSWGDAVMAGRVMRGETWRFESLAHELRLTVGPSLAYLERYTLTPSDRAIDRPWSGGGASYLATSLVHHPGATGEEAQRLHSEMAEVADVRAAVDLIAPRLLLARFLAGNGAPFDRARASYRRLVLRSIFDRPELAGRK